MRKLFLFFAGAFLMTASINAQVLLTPSVMSSAGGYGENANMSISWTLGELAVSTLKGGNIMITQGFQQPFDVGVGIDRDEVSWNISVYPNPVADELRIRFDIEKPGNYLVEIQDVTGRLINQGLQKNIYPGDIVTLNTSSLSVGIYFVKVLTPDRQQIQVSSISKQ